MHEPINYGDLDEKLQEMLAGYEIRIAELEFASKFDNVFIFITIGLVAERIYQFFS